MSNQPNTEVMIDGRLVCGHPMTRRGVTKQNPQTKVEEPVLDNVTGLQVTEAYFAVAVPKNGSTDWKLTPWGAPIAARAVQDWPNGEHGAPDFSWKITDGDSLVPNKKGRKPAEREGWPGHWIVHCSTRFNVKSYHDGKNDPTQQIQEENAIKCGDYCRAMLGVKGNGPTQSPGVYVNPMLFELSRAGVAIISDGGPSAADAFGGAVQQPAVRQPAVQQPAVQPAPDLLQPTAPTQGANFLQPTTPAAPAAPAEPMYRDPTGAGPFTAAQLAGAGYTPEAIAALPRA